MTRKLIAAVCGIAACVVTLSGCVRDEDEKNLLTGSLRSLPKSHSVDGKSVSRPASHAAYDNWWHSFGSVELTQLVEQALARNNGLVQAAARLDAAAARQRQVAAGLFPSIGGSVELRRSLPIRGRSAQSRSTNTASVTTRWQPDIFGGRKLSLKAAEAELRAAGFSLGNVQLAVAAEVIINYLTLCASQESMQAAQMRLETTQNYFKAVAMREKLGLDAATDRDRAGLNIARNQDRVLELQLAASEARNRIAILMDHAPGGKYDGIGTACRVSTKPDKIITDFPADLLRRRPDVLVAEANLEAAAARIGIARSELYPALTLSKTISTSALKLTTLPQSIIADLVASLTATIFDFGQRKAVIAERRAQAKEALGLYRATLLTALEDVSNTIKAIEIAEARLRVAQSARRLAAKNAAAVKEQVRLGFTDVASAFDDADELFAAQQLEIEQKLALATAKVRLFVALGGGWRLDVSPVSVEEARKIPE
jgi:outer membrane protein, multidrug efflux system